MTEPAPIPINIGLSLDEVLNHLSDVEEILRLIRMDPEQHDDDQATAEQMQGDVSSTREAIAEWQMVIEDRHEDDEDDDDDTVVLR